MFNDYLRKFQGPFNQVSKFYDVLKNVLRVFFGSLEGFSRGFQSCFKEGSRKCAKCFKEVLCRIIVLYPNSFEFLHLFFHFSHPDLFYLIVSYDVDLMKLHCHSVCLSVIPYL